VKNSEIRGSQLLEVTDLAKAPTISQVEAIDYAIADTSTGVFQKNGFLIIPKLNAYYGTMLNTLPVYFELYNANKSQSRYFIEEALIDTENQRELFSFHKSTELTERDQVVPLIKRVDISNLASGAYAYSVSLTNEKDSILYSSEYFFERGNITLDDTINYANTILDPNFQQSIPDDSLHFYLGSLLPIVKTSENKNIRNLLKSKDYGTIRKYFQAFWNSTSPGDVTYAWLKYKQQVQYVQGLYKTNFQPGYETDRGRVYLQYGAPSSVNAREDSPSEYPYEIWFYNKIGKFSNRRFIFYNPDLTNNAYRLLHSDLVGEVKNPGWSQILSKRNTINGTVDDPNLFNERHWGQNSNDLFRQY
jgi:GWxTD domain-containing protein